ncbi:hypothetical protein VA596_23835 [Amycolatopsis sp., V23-08]|uniref:Beta-mannosidase n=1 Tax=Amycolatopsis heterodermiae TaxID=3110235 RepID=A0ABU5R8M2_9PSEU|nr:hypothetical protein [Amycolatopsis sp., V23-08]MEA5362588.1 hypothetical protein [Amycolatopsis sp., V23-08]
MGEDGVNGVRDGDRHDWEVWHGLVAPGFATGSPEYPTPGDVRHYRRYADDTGRFVSEFGILSAPDRGTLDRWLPGVALHDEIFDRHLTDDPPDKGDALLEVTTGVPSDVDEFTALTQAVQAEGMAFAIEHFRRRQPHTAGALVWQFNDTWPAMSWSLVDVDGVPKAAYYAVARASAPPAASFRAVGDAVELWLVNNTRSAATVAIDVELGRFDGADWRVERVTGSASPGTSKVVWTGHVRQDAAHHAWASSPDSAFPSARKHFAELGELEVGDGKVDVVAVEGGLEVHSHGYSYGVRITHPEPTMRLEDNCFYLRTGKATPA